jgi:hypothetical protein
MLQYMHGKWDTTIKFYEQNQGNPKFGLQARTMLEVIPIIRSSPEFKDVLGCASHAVLLMSMPCKISYLNVWAEDENTFLVYIEHPKKDMVGVYVTRKELMPTLMEYLQKLE